MTLRSLRHHHLRLLHRRKPHRHVFCLENPYDFLYSTLYRHSDIAFSTTSLNCHQSQLPAQVFGYRTDFYFIHHPSSILANGVAVGSILLGRVRTYIAICRLIWTVHDSSSIRCYEVRRTVHWAPHFPCRQALPLGFCRTVRQLTI